RTNASPIHDAMRIADRDDTSRDARADQGIGAWRCTTGVRAWLERDVERRAPRARARALQRFELGMRETDSPMPSRTDHSAASREDRTHVGLRTRVSSAPFRQP